MPHQRIISSVTSDLVSDQRVHRVCSTLYHQSYDVILIGRKKRNSLSIPGREYKTRRLVLPAEKGALFYACFNLVLFIRLLFSRADLLISNDLDSLPANALVSRLRGIPLLYDSHEFFTEVPELIDRPAIRNIWLWLEKFFIGWPSAWMTVSASIAKAYNERYGIEMEIVRNFPEIRDAEGEIPEDKKIEKNGRRLIIYQGSVNVDRGLAEMMDAMEDLPDFELLICGDGDVYGELQQKKKSLPSGERIRFTGRIALEELHYYTAQADLGISIEKLRGLSYSFALPNKVFDYLQAGLPVLVSALPEVMNLNDDYHFAQVIKKVEPQSIVNAVKDLFGQGGRILELRQKAQLAAKELNWDAEKNKVLKLVRGLLSPS